MTSIGKHRNSLSSLIVFRAKNSELQLKVIATILNRARSFWLLRFNVNFVLLAIAT